MLQAHEECASIAPARPTAQIVSALEDTIPLCLTQPLPGISAKPDSDPNTALSLYLMLPLIHILVTHPYPHLYGCISYSVSLSLTLLPTRIPIPTLTLALSLALILHLIVTFTLTVTPHPQTLLPSVSRCTGMQQCCRTYSLTQASAAINTTGDDVRFKIVTITSCTAALISASRRCVA